MRRQKKRSIHRSPRGWLRRVVGEHSSGFVYADRESIALALSDRRTPRLAARWILRTRAFIFEQRAS